MRPEQPDSDAETSPALRRVQPGEPDAAPSAARRAVDPRRFGPSVGYAVLGTLLPGTGLLRAGRRLLGGLMLAGALLAGVAAVLIGWRARPWLLGQAFAPASLTALWVGVLVVAALWIASVVATHLLLRPLHPRPWQRIVGALVVAALAFGIAAPAAVVARRLYDQASFVSDVFSERPGGAGTTTTRKGPLSGFSDPWADRPRLNVLVLGGDSGQGRAVRLGARTDTVILASINTATGDTVLYQLPRQTARMPFPAGSALAERFPRGFTDGNPRNANFFLNSMYDNAPALTGPDILGRPVANLGAEILKISVGEALGLKVDHYVMISMDGFIRLIDALGGVTVNVNKPVAMGGKTGSPIERDTPPKRWLFPGPDQHLNGEDALWYARGRYKADDYERGVRQRCVINAVVRQANPASILANYEEITSAGRQIIQTDVPGSELPALITLVTRVRDQSMRSVAFVTGQNGFVAATPDWDRVRSRVRSTLDPPARTVSPAPASPRPTSSPTKAPPVADTDDACAYRPEQPFR